MRGPEVAQAWDVILTALELKTNAKDEEETMEIIETNPEIEESQKNSTISHILDTDGK